MQFAVIVRRSLQWERGLKYKYNTGVIAYAWSFPAMGTWIEMPGTKKKALSISRRSLQWERGLKSFPKHFKIIRFVVVPCNGNVDWNFSM